LTAPRLLLLVTVVLAAVGAFGLTKLRNEEDVLVFLPEGEPEVVTFKEVARKFGAMRVALIGVQPKSSTQGKKGPAELFSYDILNRIGELSEALKNTQGVDRVLSLSTMTDLHPSEGGVDIQPLLPSPLPTDPAELRRLKAHALTLPQVRGNVISADGRAAQLMVFLAEGTKSQPLAETARALAIAKLGEVADLYFGGAPFAGQAVYNDTQHDVRRLTPLALMLFFVIVLLAFRGFLPVALTVATVGLSGVLVVGGMGFFREAFTVVTGTLPLILFASGSQYAIHILGRYYLIRESQRSSGNGSPLAAAAQAIRIAGPPVAVAAVNCCLGFLSFSVMNIRAMRTFGYTCSIGVLFCLLFALTVLPAVVARWEPASASGGDNDTFSGLGRRLLQAFRFAQRRRVLVVGVTLLVALYCGIGMTRVQVRMEPRAFFREGSEPALSQQFLDNTFGGAQFAQILIEGDLTDPRALAEVRRLCAFARSLPRVTQVQSIVEPLALVGEAMAGLHGLPATRGQVGTLLFFMEGDASLRTLLTPDRSAALVHVRLLGDAQPVLAELERYLSSRWPFRLRRPTVSELAEELSFLLPAAERPARMPQIAAAVQKVMSQGLALGGPAPKAKAEAPAGQESEGGSEEDLDAAEAARTRAAQKAGTRILMAALSGGSATQLVPDTISHLEARRSTVELVTAALIQPEEDPPPSSGASADAQVLRGRLTGEPMLDRGFSRAVAHNQWASLAVALSTVLLALLIAQRSLAAAVLSLLPAVMALMVVFGTLGLVGQPIDLGTSLVGSIVTSSGADFAMHYIWYLRRRPVADVVPTVGPVIFTTAALLGLGMGVMMLGGSPPIRLFGGLACAGMLLSALFTFLLVPALLRLPADKNLSIKESV
jgi:predicted RND superfamily exporter protein